MIKGYMVIFVFLLIFIAGCKSQQADTSTSDTSQVNVAGNTPKAAFDSYRKAMVDQNLDDLRKYVSSEMIAQLEQSLPGGLNNDNFKQIAALAVGFMPTVDNMVIEEEKITGDTAIWVVSDKNNPNNSGTVSFVKEGNRWKVVTESWTSRGSF